MATFLCEDDFSSEEAWNAYLDALTPEQSLQFEEAYYDACDETHGAIDHFMTTGEGFEKIEEVSLKNKKLFTKHNWHDCLAFYARRWRVVSTADRCKSLVLFVRNHQIRPTMINGHVSQGVFDFMEAVSLGSSLFGEGSPNTAGNEPVSKEFSMEHV